MTIRRTVMALVACWCALTCLAGRYVEDSVKVDGHMRHLVMYLPNGLPDDAPVGAISEGDGKYEINPDLCIECGACAAGCPVGTIDLE